MHVCVCVCACGFSQHLEAWYSMHLQLLLVLLLPLLLFLSFFLLQHAPKYVCLCLGHLTRRRENGSSAILNTNLNAASVAEFPVALPLIRV